MCYLLTPSTALISSLNMSKYFLCAYAALFAVTTSATAQTAANCDTAAGLAAARTKVESTFRIVKEDQRQRQAQIDRELAARASAQKWSKDRQSQLFMGILSSPTFAAFEQKKQPYTAELMKIAMAGQTADSKQVCADVVRLNTIVEKIKVVNVQQYAFMLSEVKAAK